MIWVETWEEVAVTEEEQSALDHRKPIGYRARPAERIFERIVVVGDEIVERAVMVTSRNTRLCHQALVDVVAPAIAARDPLDVAILERFPTGTVTERAYRPVGRRRNHAT